ncbi:MAG: hypothetical protein ACI4O8_06560 [Aristaeellaceae bacterium]
MKRTDWQNAFGEVDEDFHLRLRSTLNELEETDMKNRKNLAVIILAAALIVALLAGAGIAASQLGVFHMLDSADPIVPLEGAQELVGTNLGAVENDLVKLTVEEAVFDGQGALVQCRLSPRDTERYAMFNSFMQDAPEEEYITETVPAEVAEGSQEIETDDGVYTIINEAEHSLLFNGVPIEFPASWDAAQAANIPVYEENGAIYYGDYREYRVLGRRDGRQTIDYWISVYTGDDRIELDAYDAEGQADGSVLVWCSGFADEKLDAEEIEAHVIGEISVDGVDTMLDEIAFTLPKTDAERRCSLQPVGEGKGERFEILSGSIIFTKVRAYMALDYRYEQAEKGEEMGIDFRLYDGDGNRITTGAGNCTEVDGIWHWNMEMQSFAEIPETIWLEAKVIGEDKTLGRVECRLIEE